MEQRALVYAADSLFTDTIAQKELVIPRYCTECGHQAWQPGEPAVPSSGVYGLMEQAITRHCRQVRGNACAVADVLVCVSNEKRL